MNLRYSGVCVSVTVLRGQPQAQVEKGVVGVREGLPGRSTSKTSGFKMFRNTNIDIYNIFILCIFSEGSYGFDTQCSKLSYFAHARDSLT